MTPEIRMTPNGVGTVNFGSVDSVNVTFYSKQVRDADETRKAGRPVYKNVDYVRIQHPGDRDYADSPVADKPMTVQLYPRQWQAYQKAKEYVPEGTPLEMLFAQVEEAPIAATLRASGIQTVEQLAALSASAMDSVGMGAQAYVNHAKKYLEMSEKGVAYHKMEKELSLRDNKIEVLENNQKLLVAQIERLSAQIQGAAQQTFLSVHSQAPIAQQAMQTPQQITQTMQQAMPQFVPAPQQVPVPWETQKPPITEQPTTEPVKKRGWPKGKPRGPRQQPTA